MSKKVKMSIVKQNKYASLYLCEICMGYTPRLGRPNLTSMKKKFFKFINQFENQPYKPIVFDRIDRIDRIDNFDRMREQN